MQDEMVARKKVYTYQINVRVSPSLAKKLDEISKAEGVSKGEIIRNLIREAHKDSSPAKPSS